MTDEARRAEYISRILNFWNIFIFTFYISSTCIECGKDVMALSCKLFKKKNSNSLCKIPRNKQWSLMRIVLYNRPRHIFILGENSLHAVVIHSFMLPPKVQHLLLEV